MRLQNRAAVKAAGLRKVVMMLLNGVQLILNSLAASGRIGRGNE